MPDTVSQNRFYHKSQYQRDVTKVRRFQSSRVVQLYIIYFIRIYADMLTLQLVVSVGIAVGSNYFTILLCAALTEVNRYSGT